MVSHMQWSVSSTHIPKNFAILDFCLLVSSLIHTRFYSAPGEGWEVAAARGTQTSREMEVSESQHHPAR